MEGSSTHLRCSARIDLCAIERNLGKLRHFLKKSETRIIALVSADAFGFGAEASVTRLMLAGVSGFAVTNALEGSKVREAAMGWPIVVMSPSLPDEEIFYFKNSLIPTLASCEEIERFEKAADKFFENNSLKKFPVHLRVPVGKNALPSSDEAKLMLEKILQSKRLELQALCIPGTGTGAPTEGFFPDENFMNFAAEKLAGNKDVFVHHSDICELSSIPENFSKCLRAGLVLFGMLPQKNSILQGFKPEPVMMFKTSVSLVKNMPKGATVGYCRKFELKKDSKIAILSLGYGDGLSRNAEGEVLIRGKRAPICGVVSMDQAAVDVSEIDGVEVGDEAVIIGGTENDFISIEEYCAPLGTTPAQALTSITKRVARFYKTLY